MNYQTAQLEKKKLLAITLGATLLLAFLNIILSILLPSSPSLDYSTMFQRVLLESIMVFVFLLLCFRSLEKSNTAPT